MLGLSFSSLPFSLFSLPFLFLFSFNFIPRTDRKTDLHVALIHVADSGAKQFPLPAGDSRSYQTRAREEVTRYDQR